MTTDLPPTPQPGEVWENDDGERRCVHSVDRVIHHFALVPGAGAAACTKDDWLGWAIRTNARRILEAKKQ